MHDHLNFLFELATAVEPSRYPCIYSSSMLESLIFCRRTNSSLQTAGKVCRHYCSHKVPPG